MTGGLGDLRVLVVDDDADQRMTVARLFRHAGAVDLIEASDAEAALQATITHRPHLIVLDLAMPRRSGYDVLPDLLDAAPQALIVILSNLPRRRLLTKLQHRGAVGYVEKRVPPERLVAEILMAAALTDTARHHVLHLPPDMTSSRTSRQFVRGLLGQRDESIARDIELLVSELVSNAVVHAKSDPRLEVRVSSGTIRVEVYDDNLSPPTQRDPDLATPGGRGLHMVERLAARWGFDHLDDGKVVWFEIERTPSLP